MDELMKELTMLVYRDKTGPAPETLNRVRAICDEVQAEMPYTKPEARLVMLWAEKLCGPQPESGAWVQLERDLASLSLKVRAVH